MRHAISTESLQVEHSDLLEQQTGKLELYADVEGHFLILDPIKDASRLGDLELQHRLGAQLSIVGVHQRYRNGVLPGGQIAKHDRRV